MKLQTLLNEYEYSHGDYGFTIILNDYVSIGLLPVIVDDNGYDMEADDTILLDSTLDNLTIMIFNYESCLQYTFINPSFNELNQYFNLWKKELEEVLQYER